MSRRRARTDQVERQVVPHDAAARLAEQLRRLVDQQLRLDLELPGELDSLYPQEELRPVRMLEALLRGESLLAISLRTGAGSEAVLQAYGDLVRELSIVWSPDQWSPDDDKVDAEEFAAYLRKSVSGQSAIRPPDPACTIHVDDLAGATTLRSQWVRCRHCPCMVPVNPPSKNGARQGRPRVTCSDACRMRDQRLRDAAAANGNV